MGPNQANGRNRHNFKLFIRKGDTFLESRKQPPFQENYDTKSLGGFLIVPMSFIHSELLRP